MIIDVLTLFPKMFKPVLSESILKRAQKKNLVKINLHNLRKWSSDRRGTVDDKPFGGGPGMVLKPEPICRAIEDLKKELSHVLLLGPGGKTLAQPAAEILSKKSHLIIISGHYEDVDARVREHLIDEELSIGDYILSCGELPAMVLMDCIIRLIPGVLGNEDANKWESFNCGLLEYPQYTRPSEFKGWKVPDVLLSGNHKQIEDWRFNKAVERTKNLRPDMYSRYVENTKNKEAENARYYQSS